MESSIHFIQALIIEYPILGKLAVNDYELIIVLWNLLLLAVPPMALAGMIRLRQAGGSARRPLTAGLFLVWLFFVPNAPYLMAEIRHIVDFCPVYAFDSCPENAWIILFFFVYAALGWVVFVYFLERMRGFIAREAKNKIRPILFVYSLMPVIALGVLLGLNDRLNSWEIFTAPFAVFAAVRQYFTDGIYFFNWVMYTAFLLILYEGGRRLYGLSKDRQGR